MSRPCIDHVEPIAYTDPPCYISKQLTSHVQFQTLDAIANRIIAGTPVSSDDLDSKYPWFVGLSIDGYDCGGSLVNTNVVLTVS